MRIRLPSNPPTHTPAVPSSPTSLAPSALPAVAPTVAPAIAGLVDDGGPALPSLRARSLVGTPTPSTVAGGHVSTVVTARTGALDPSDGLRKAKTRADLDTLAVQDDVPGAAGVKTVKFLITDVDTGNPKIFLMNTAEHGYHFSFASKVFGLPNTNAALSKFNGETYFTDNRKNIAGTIVIHDNYTDDQGEKGLYSVEFWPTDPVRAKHVNTAFDLVAKALPFAKGKLAYHPAGDTQEALAKEDAAALKRMKVPVISTEKLFAGVTYSPLNPGLGVGRLRVIDGASNQDPPTVRDVVIFKNIPNDLSHVGGIITESPQTPLSHINLKAKQNDTPNAFIKDATSDPEIQALVGKIVKYEVGPNGYTIREATQAEQDAWLESVRPANPQEAGRDLSKTDIVAFKDLGMKDARAYGAKTANLAELNKILGADQAPDGFGIPFSFYDTFMKENGLYDAAETMMRNPRFESDAAYREQQLSDFRRRIRRAEVPASLAADIAALHAKFPPDQPIRCRSSTNNEDLEGFNGAGLYDSYTHRPDEGDLANTIKQTWSSLWSFRAFEERTFWRIDHLSAAMGVTVHANFDDEIANGVALTKNIYDPNWPGFYVNVQVGESLVTNPTPGATPEEMLISAIGPNGEWEVQKLRRSTENGGKDVLSPAQIDELTVAMKKIQDHFKRAYGKQNDPHFAMDIEFKIGVDGTLVVKQARPVVD